ncbi:uncharacterized protein LOC120202439 [Hibiscus syriacus]|uniref:uncharacterized protein LOC120202439 n=1 Tax=Hibiscus syriacus TaxID=106335 RepID=UPI00192110E4|nr:uncharacterized protein LOC120202439 [Hibiscus syriacus]
MPRHIEAKAELCGGRFLGGARYHGDWSWCTVCTLACVAELDEDSIDMLSADCPRLIINPKFSLFGFKGTEVPRDAFPDVALGDLFVKDIDPKTWSIARSTPKAISVTSKCQ